MSHKTEKNTKRFHLPDDSRFKFPSKKEKMIAFNLSSSHFPVLTDSSHLPKASIVPNFISAVQKEVVKEKEEENKLPPGWVGMRLDKSTNTIIHTEGELGPYFKKLHIQNKREENPNYRMNKVVAQMMRTWETYKYNYEETFGEGVYEEVYECKNVCEFEEEEDDYEEREENDQDAEMYEFNEDYY